jgi:predicted RND superfamily exporter protein
MHDLTYSPPKSSRNVIKDIADFDPQSGSRVERAIFNNRLVIVIICALLTIFLGYQTSKLKLNANYEGTIPLHDPFMVNYLAHAGKLQSQGNALRIAVQANDGTIASVQYLATLGALTNDVLNLPGINRPLTTSLWTPNTRWTGVEANTITSGTVIDDSYEGLAAQVPTVMANIKKTGRIGDLVGTDFQSSMIYAPLMDHNGITGGPIDYGQLAADLDALRTTYARQGVTLHITGFAMVVGDMILGIRKILLFFLLSTLVAGAMLYWFTRSASSTALVVSCTLVAVIWQLGLLPLMGYDLDPYSVLVPFLIFAIGMSHGAQKMNGVMQDIGRGTHRLIAARYTFRRLFVAGFTALVCDAVGFSVLGLIKIQEIRELAVIASCGVAILIFTNLILLPILLSYVGVDKKAAVRSLRAEAASGNVTSNFVIWNFLACFTRRRWAVPTLAIAIVLGIGGFAIGRHAQIGSVSDGAPELRQNSQYNTDIRYMQNHYRVSSDTLVVLVDSQPYTCTNYAELSTIDRLGWQLDQMPEVQSTSSLASVMSYLTQLMTDESPKWNQVVDSQALLDSLAPQLPLGYDSFDCSFIPVNIALRNLKATSLGTVVSAIQTFMANPENQSPAFKMSLAGGNGGIAAATDRVIQQANTHMLLWIYAAVAVLCFVTFRSWLAVVCAILPLLLTSVLCQALMVVLGIGITVATLPVVALGVGIGVDYALYVLGVMMTHLRAGVPLEEAYLRSLRFTGRVVMLTGFTLAIGVGTWIFAPIKFQADMGLLLAFMFLWNMFGALVILPALASFLLKPEPPGKHKAV